MMHKKESKEKRDKKAVDKEDQSDEDFETKMDKELDTQIDKLQREKRKKLKREKIREDKKEFQKKMSVVAQGGMTRQDDELVLGRRLMRKLEDKNIEDFEYLNLSD